MIHFRLFGTIELRNERSIDLHSVVAHTKHVALLAYLVAGRVTQRRDRLTALLWPELGDARARHALTKAVHHLRRALGETAIISRGNEEVELNVAEWDSDLIAFEEALDRGAYADAIEIYGKGELLDGFHLPDAPEFERWLDATRERFRERAATSAMALTSIAEKSNDLAAAQRWSYLACELSPYDELTLRRHLALLDRIGDRAGALVAYQKYADRLAGDLDVEPSPETRGVVNEIRSRHEGRSSRHRAPEHTVRETEAASGSELLRSDTPRESSESAEVGSGRRDREFNRWIMLAVAIVALIGTGVTIAVARSRISPSHAQHRILVAAFENRTGDVRFDPLGNMAADWITEGLQEAGVAEIVDPLSALIAARHVAPDTNRRTSLDRAAAMADHAGADIVVWGAVYRQGDSLIYRVQIGDLSKQRQLATIEPVISSVGDAIGGANRLRAKVAGALASALDQRVASVSATSSRPPSFDAYKEYVLGLEKFASPQSEFRSIPHFEAAIRLDPDFALPVIWSIFAYGNAGKDREKDSLIHLLDSRRERLRPLDKYALEFFLARQRNDANAQLHAAEAAARLSPGSEWSHNAALLLLGKNRPAESLKYFRQIDPEHGWARSWGPYWRYLGVTLHVLGKYDEELEASERIRRIDPIAPSADVLKANALIGAGRAEEGERVAEGLLTRPHEDANQINRVHAMAQELSAHGHPRLAKRLWVRIIAWNRVGVNGPLPASLEDTGMYRRKSQHSLGQALYNAGHAEEAGRIFTALAMSDSADIDAWGFLGLVAAHRNDRVGAERIMKFLETPFAIQNWGFYPSQYLAAEVAAALGHREHSVNLLRSLIDRGSGWPPWLHRDPDWTALRDYPPFRELTGTH